MISSWSSLFSITVSHFPQCQVPYISPGEPLPDSAKGSHSVKNFCVFMDPAVVDNRIYKTINKTINNPLTWWIRQSVKAKGNVAYYRYQINTQSS